MATENMTYTPAAIENGIPGYFEIRNSDGMIIGNAITNDSPFEGCQPVTIEDAERNAKLWCAAPGLLGACEAVIRLKDLIAYKEPVKPEHEGEAQAISAALLKIKLAINKATI